MAGIFSVVATGGIEGCACVEEDMDVNKWAARLLCGEKCSGNYRNVKKFWERELTTLYN